MKQGLKNKKIVLIDLDDTLWDTWGNNKESLNELYTALQWGQYFSSFSSFFDEYYYPVNHKLWSLYNEEAITKEDLSLRRLYEPILARLKELGLDDKYIQLSEDTHYWIEANESFLELVRGKTRTVEGAIDLLRYLSERYELCILSNGFGEVQYVKLERSGMSPYIKKVFLSDEIGYNKPNPKIFEYALQEMGASGDEVVMIGDSWASDVVGASSAGLDVIWFNPYKLRRESENLSVSLEEVHTLADIKQLL